MSENKKNEENKNEKQDKVFKKNFFTKLWYSITKIEKYPEMATEGVGRALSYIYILVIILAILLSTWMTIETHTTIEKATDYLKNEFPEFYYKEGSLKVESEEPITIENNELIGKIIIDTNTDSEETINNYINSIGQYNNGIVILKDRAIITNMNVKGSISYNYREMLKSMNINEFSKDNIIEFANSNMINGLYISLFITLLIYSFVMYLLTTLWYVVIISIFGYFTAWVLKIKMRYAPIFNMSIYAITLSILLNIAYLIINTLTNFTIEYFQVMYIAVATIYLIAAIFIIKSEFIKKQAELMKIVEVQAKIKPELEQQENDDERNEEKKEKDENKDLKQKEETKDENQGEEPEGSKA